ncbi:MAG: MAPEG family protein [Rhizomicrobium sp.]
MPDNLLTPVLALVVWTLIIWIWMYATRIPAINAAKIDPDAAKHPGSLDVLPSRVRAVADNYNHLMEQPTIFYALVFYIYLAGRVDQTAVWLAWAYVVLRVVHSLIQCTTNKVTLRFTVFALSTLVLMIMAVREILPFLGL